MNLKRKLNKELDAIVRDYESNRALPAASPVPQKPSRKLKAAFYSALSAVAAVCVALTVLLAVPPKLPPTTRYLTLRINPSVAFTLTDGAVSRVTSLNDDCDVMLSNGFRAELIGKSAEEAAALFADRAARLGYIDMTAPAAVKIGSDGVYTASSVKNAVDVYFKAHGMYAAVVAVKEDGIAQLVEGADSFAEREIASLSPDELASRYADEADKHISEAMRAGLSARIDKIEEYKALLCSLEQLNDLIEAHEDNPVVISPVKDYFIVKQLEVLYPPSGYSQEFGALMKEFESKLAAYEALGGIAPSSGMEISAARTALEMIPLDTLRYLAHGEERIVSALYESLADILKYTGLDISGQLALFENAPTQPDEYLSSMNKLFDAESAARAQEFAQAYETERDKISDSDYDSYVKGIIAEYGSLEKYFDLQNK